MANQNKQKTLKESVVEWLKKKEIMELTSKQLQRLPMKKKEGNRIEKKIWPQHFEEILKDKKFEIRLADFEIKKGDILVLKEFNHNKDEFTGRKVERRVKKVNKINIFDYYNINDLKEKGIFVIELE